MNESSKGWYGYWTGPNGYNSKDIFKFYDQLELIYDPERWSSTYHRECPESVLKMVYSRVQPRLIVQTSLPIFLRRTTEKEAIEQMRSWLKLAYHIKSTHTMGARYLIFVIFVTFKSKLKNDFHPSTCYFRCQISNVSFWVLMITIFSRQYRAPDLCWHPFSALLGQRWRGSWYWFQLLVL